MSGVSVDHWGLIITVSACVVNTEKPVASIGLPVIDPGYRIFSISIANEFNGTGRTRTGDLALQICVSFPTLWTIPSP